MLGVILASFVLCFTNCENKSQNISKDTIVFGQFAKTLSLNFDNFLKLDHGSTRKLYLTDSSLIVCNLQGSAADYFFYQYSLSDKSFISRQVKGGRGAGQALNAFSSGLYRKNAIWLQDISLNKILITHLNNKASVNDSLNFQEYKVPKFFYSVELMNSLKLLATGAYHTPNKMLELDLSTTSRLTEFGTFSNAPKDIPFYSWTRAYESFLFLKPTEDKAVLACRYTDQVQIFDLSTKKSKIVRGPENYEPEFTPITVQNNDMIERNSKTRFAFVNGMVTNRYIYLLYSGNPHESKYKIDGKVIYIYDWMGNPVSKVDLDRYISGFTVSDDDSEMYAFDPNTGYIIKTKLKK